MPKQDFLKQPDFPLQYRAIGYLEGKIEKKGAQWFLHPTKSDAVVPVFPCGDLIYWLRTRLRDSPQEVGGNKLWSLYPRTCPETGIVSGQLRHFESDEKEKRATNFFSIRGTIKTIADDGFFVRISANKKYNKKQANEVPGKKKRKAIAPFLLKIKGALPGAKQGDFWDLDCHVDDEGFFVVDFGKKIASGKKKKSGKKSKFQKRPNGKKSIKPKKTIALKPKGKKEAKPEIPKDPKKIKLRDLMKGISIG
jgi:hypothetical protein